MYYEINVSDQNGHVFATAERSLQNEAAAKRVYALLKEKFPAAEGYKVQCLRWDVQGHQMTFDNVEA